MCDGLSRSEVQTLHAQGTAFTYQGRLNDGGAPANGNYDFRFRLSSDPLGNTYVGSAFLTNGLAVSNGLFTTTLDFGPGIFNGNNYSLEVDVKTNGAGAYENLNPLQALTPTPYAVFASGTSNLLGRLSADGLAGTYGNAVTFENASNSFSGIGTGLTALNASQLTSGTVPDAAPRGKPVAMQPPRRARNSLAPATISRWSWTPQESACCDWNRTRGSARVETTPGI